jgi:hypothetical protein
MSTYSARGKETTVVEEDEQLVKYDIHFLFSELKR